MKTKGSVSKMPQTYYLYILVGFVNYQGLMQHDQTRYCHKLVSSLTSRHQNIAENLFLYISLPLSDTKKKFTRIMILSLRNFLEQVFQFHKIKKI